MKYPDLLLSLDTDCRLRPKTLKGPHLGRIWPLIAPAFFLLNPIQYTERHSSPVTEEISMSDFIEAVKSSDVEFVRYHLMNDIDVNRRSSQDGTTGLYWAACMGHVQLCHMLIERGANVDSVASQWGSRPLHAAADRGKEDCVFLLIKSGAAVNVQSTTNLDTPLHKAAYRGHHEVCRLLLQNGADTSLRNKEGKTARQEAQNRKHYYIHTLILDYEQGKKVMDPGKPVTEIYKRPQHQPVIRAEITSPLSRRDYGGGIVYNGEDDGQGYVTIEANSAGMTDPEDDCRSFLQGSNEHEREFNNSRCSTTDNATDLSMLVNYSEGETTNGDSIMRDHSIESHVDERNIDKAESTRTHLGVCQNTGSHNTELNSSRGYIQRTVDKLRNLEIFTEKLQIAITQYKDRVSELKSENEELKKIVKSMGDLEEQLRIAKLQVDWHSATADASNNEISLLKQQVVTLQQQYTELEKAYNTVCDYFKSHERCKSTNGSSSLVAGLESMNDVTSDSYDADIESLSRRLSHHKHLISGNSDDCRLIGRGLLERGLPTDTKDQQLEKSPNSSSSDNSSPPPVPPCSRNESPRDWKFYAQNPHTSSDSNTSSIREPHRSRSRPASCSGTQQMNTKPLYDALAPVFTAAGREFVDMLSASLLFQTKSSMEQNPMVSHLLDLPGNAWNADDDFTISDEVCPIHCTTDLNKPFAMALNITHDNNDYKLKVILDKIIDGSTMKPANVNQVQLIQNIVLRNPHRNVARILHGFRQNPSIRIRSYLPTMLQDRSVDLAALHTVNPNFPGNLCQLADYARERFEEPIKVFPECFILQQLYGLLSGLVYIRQHCLVHGNLSTGNIEFDSGFNPVINNLEFGFSTRGINGSEITLSDRPQLYLGFKEIVPPEVVHLRKTWTDGASNKGKLRELYRSSDVYVLGTIFLHLLCRGWRKSSGAATSASSEKFPSGYSAALFALLNWLVTESYRSRPSPRKAKIRTGILLFGPGQGEVNNIMECQIWQQTRMMKLLMQTTNGSAPRQFCEDYMRTIKSSTEENGRMFEQDYLVTTPASELWSVYKDVDWPT